MIDEEIEEDIKEGTADLEKILGKIEEEAREHEEKIEKTCTDVFSRVKEDLEKKEGRGYIKEAIASCDATLKYIAELTVKKPAGIRREEVTSEYDNYQKELKRRRLRWGSALDKKVKHVLKRLNGYRAYLLDAAEYDAKISLKEAIKELLEDEREKINAFEIQLERLTKERIDNVTGIHINIPDTGDLIVSDFSLPELKLDNIKQAWIGLNEDKITNKVKSSLQPKLSSFSFDEISEGWRSPKGEKASSKDRKKVVVVPEYASRLVGKENFDYVLSANGGKDVSAYKFTFGIPFKEVEVV